MATLATNRILHRALHLQTRRLAISSSFTACRDYASSCPVRFIPGAYKASKEDLVAKDERVVRRRAVRRKSASDKLRFSDGEFRNREPNGNLVTKCEKNSSLKESTKKGEMWMVNGSSDGRDGACESSGFKEGGLRNKDQNGESEAYLCNDEPEIGVLSGEIGTSIWLKGRKCVKHSSLKESIKKDESRMVNGSSKGREDAWEPIGFKEEGLLNKDRIGVPEAYSHNYEPQNGVLSCQTPTTIRLKEMSFIKDSSLKESVEDDESRMVNIRDYGREDAWESSGFKEEGLRNRDWNGESVAYARNDDPEIGVLSGETGTSIRLKERKYVKDLSLKESVKKDEIRMVPGRADERGDALESSCFNGECLRNNDWNGVPVAYTHNDEPVLSGETVTSIRLKESSQGSYLKDTMKKNGNLMANVTTGIVQYANEIGCLDDELHNQKAGKSILGQVETMQIKDSSKLELKLVDIDLEDDTHEEEDDPEMLNQGMISSGNVTISMKAKEEAEKLAIELLARRAFTTFELSKKLRGKKYPPGVVASVMSDIKSRGLLNDCLYAEAFSQSRWLSYTWGPRRIKHALVKKGIGQPEAEDAAKQVFEEDGNAMSQASLDLLFVQASKQWLRIRDASPENRAARMVRWLQYRGFNWGVTGLILKRLQSVYPS